MVFCTEQGCEKTIMIGDEGLKKATSQATYLGHFQPPAQRVDARRFGLENIIQSKPYRGREFFGG
jgi:hypothetical protein